MKSLIICLAVVLLGLTACQKENVEPTNCGLINTVTVNEWCIYFRMSNNATGNIENFCVDFDTMLEYEPGDIYCVDSVTTW
jgi:hypothetical protein